MIQFAEVYYRAGAVEKGNKMLETLTRLYVEDITYYTKLKPDIAKYYEKDKQQAAAVLQRIQQVADGYKQSQISKKIGSFLATNPALMGN